MESSLILDHDVERRRIALPELREEQRVDVLVDGGREQQLQTVFAVHLHGFMQVAPLIPSANLVYVYTIGALVKDWDAAWKIGETMLEPIVFRLPDGKKG